MMRWCDAAVEWRRSRHSVANDTAVSKPNGMAGALEALFVRFGPAAEHHPLAVVGLGLEQPMVAVADAPALPPAVLRRQHRGADDGVDARRIAAAGADGDAADARVGPSSWLSLARVRGRPAAPLRGPAV